MDAVSILLAIGLAVLVGVFIAFPLRGLGQSPASGGTTDELTAGLKAEREAVLSALRELDFDHLTGKVADEDYAPQRAALMGRGVALLQQLETVAQPPAASAEAQLEAEVRAARARHTERPAAPRFCPQCGAPRLAPDRFCAKCGTALTEAV